MRKKGLPDPAGLSDGLQDQSPVVVGN